MSVVTKEEWLEWKSNMVTKEFMKATQERIEDAKDLLSMQAGLDSISDSYFRGFIVAYREMQEFRVEDLNED